MSKVSGVPKKRLNLSCKVSAKPGIFYHYTSLKTLWAILDSESLRATQARFSNDSEEIKKGAHILAEICRSFEKQGESNSLRAHAERLQTEDGADIDCYIVCFCGRDDILSQWRGYCRQDGVSIGFAFDQTKPQFYFADEPTDSQQAHEIQLYPVWYVKEPDSRASEENSSGMTITKEDLSRELEEKIKEIDELVDEATGKAFIDSTIPLIKHAGFCEENEYRLLISNTHSEYRGTPPFPLDLYVKYTDENNTKRPYITISFGKRQSTRASDTIKIKLCGLSINAERELCRLLEHKSKHSTCSAEKSMPKYQFEGVAGNFDKNPQIVIGQTEDSVQKEVFESIDRILTADKAGLFKNVNLWCDGHLPIRSIRVSPCENQQEVIESIKHYCTHHKFWMKYVKVLGSNTPYRRPK